jgi:hypothetical protein
MSREPRPAALVTDTVIEDTAVSLMTHLRAALKFDQGITAIRIVRKPSASQSSETRQGTERPVTGISSKSPKLGGRLNHQLSHLIEVNLA